MKKSTLSNFTTGIIGFILLSFFSFKVSAQLNITPMTPLQLVQNVLVGGGVNISNITITKGTSSMYGSFTNGSTTNLGLNKGIILSTGKCSEISNPVAFFMDNHKGLPGDDDLNIITNPDTTRDACVLEFDFKPTSDTIRFRYVFGSEEYPENVCSSYNDVFGFFLSGPGISGPYQNGAVNLALIPGTTLPVAINTINNGTMGANGIPGGCTSLSYSSLYIDNEALGGTTIAFDGFTKVFTSWHVVTPCQKYHIKLAIADVNDDEFDSGVFLEANSFGTNGSFTETTFTSDVDTAAVEGCNNAIVSFNFSQAVTDTTVIHYTVAGNAIEGTDYAVIPDSLVLLPGADSTGFWISPFVDALTEGTDTVLIIYQNIFCATMDTIVVLIKDHLPLSVHSNTLYGCSGGPIYVDLGITGGYPPFSYTWTGGYTTPTITVFPTVNTTYTLNVHDNCGGNKNATADVHVSYLSAAITSADTAISCYGLYEGSATVTATGGVQPYTYGWSPAGGQYPTADSLAAGTYIVCVTDSFSCLKYDTIVITQPPLLTATVSNLDSVSCHGLNNGSISVAVNGGTPGYSYHWNTNPVQSSATASNLPGGTYTVTVTDNNSCIATATATVFEPTAFSASMTDTTVIQCYGGNNGSLTVTATGGTPTYTYNWNTTPVQHTPTASNLTAGTYMVTVTDHNGCSYVLAANLSQPAQMFTNITDVDSAKCYGGSTGSITIAVAGGTPPCTYLWNTIPPQTTLIASNIPAGIYTVTVTDHNGCNNTVSDTVFQPTQINALITNIDSVICYGESNGSVTVIASGGTPGPGYNYLWNTTPSQSTATALNVPAGTYTVTVSDKNGCTQSTFAQVLQPNELLITLDPDDVTCPNSQDGEISTDVNGGVGPYTYLWSNGQITQTCFDLIPGSYSLTVTDHNGCTEINNAVIGTETNLDASFSANPLSGTLPLTVQFTFTGADADTYYWDFGDGNTSTLQNPQNIYTTANTFTATLYVNSGTPNFCADTFSLTIKTDNPSFIIVPNVFTPNSDGANDDFHVQYGSINTFKCVIFNRWGKKIYEWNDVSQGWNGKTDSGTEASEGVYYYVIEALGIDDIEYKLNGTITLMK